METELAPSRKNVDPVLLVDRRNRIWLAARDGVLSAVAYTLAGPDRDAEAAALLARLDGASAVHPFFATDNGTCRVAFCDDHAGGRFVSLDRIQSRGASGEAKLDPESAALLNAMQPHLFRLPYLQLGENEYIFRFRTQKERNRSVYVTESSRALYQSELCEVIKAARRTKEKLSGAPAELDFGAVRYVLPSHFGFCLGVQNAIERAYETVAANPDRNVYMLSELIHNPFVNGDLLRRGLRYLQTDKGLPLRADGKLAHSADDPGALWNRLSEEDIVIIPAFGATNEDKMRLIRRGIDIRSNDATCMLVEKVWKAARRYASEGYTVIIHGKSEHEETKATFSNSACHGPALMIRNMQHAIELGEVIRSDGDERRQLFRKYFTGLHSDGFDPVRDLEKVAVVNQTTLLRNETIRIIDHLSAVMCERYGADQLKHHIWTQGKGDTLCYATQVNQDALNKALDLELDAALVVGGRNSSNTYQLFRLCEETCGERAFYIQSEANLISRSRILHYTYPYHMKEPPAQMDVEKPFLPAADRPLRILITGGASCPDGIIQQVINRINSFFPPERIRPLAEVLARLAD